MTTTLTTTASLPADLCKIANAIAPQFDSTPWMVGTWVMVDNFGEVYMSRESVTLWRTDKD